MHFIHSCTGMWDQVMTNDQMVETNNHTLCIITIKKRDQPRQGGFRNMVFATYTFLNINDYLDQIFFRKIISEFDSN